MPGAHKPKRYSVDGGIVHLPHGGQVHLSQLQKLRQDHTSTGFTGEWKRPVISNVDLAEEGRTQARRGDLMLALSRRSRNVYTYTHGEGGERLTPQLSARQLDEILRAHGG